MKFSYYLMKQTSQPSAPSFQLENYCLCFQPHWKLKAFISISTHGKMHISLFVLFQESSLNHVCLNDQGSEDWPYDFAAFTATTSWSWGWRAICELISTTKCAKKQEIQEMDELFPFAGDIIAPKGSMQLFYAKLTRWKVSWISFWVWNEPHRWNHIL